MFEALWVFTLFLYLIFGFVTFGFALRAGNAAITAETAPIMKFLYWHGIIFILGFVAFAVLSFAFSGVYLFIRV